ncbi:DinB family protein [Sphaerisporangium sp. B11E5]|uniref:DinB family protein n=1 Tax=Sphaerisporangium sp. B11E5 TaxID=3153563 RepID=UPI00325F0F96
MADSDTSWAEPPWEPPLAGTEAEHLAGALDRLRATFRWKADGLDPAGLRVRVGASALTIGGLLKHLARVEEQCFGTKLSGTPLGPPWDAVDWQADPDWDFTSAADDTPAQLYALYDDAVARSRTTLDAALRNGGLDQLVHLAWPDGRRAGLRRIVCDLIEEYGRHTGQADLLREAVDGRVGEDPPAAWRPVRAAGS